MSSYNKSVGSFLLLPSVLCRRCRRLSRLRRRIGRGGGRPRRRRIHKDFIRHPETDLLPLVHVEVVGALVRLVLPEPDLLCFIAGAAAKERLKLGTLHQTKCHKAETLEIKKINHSRLLDILGQDTILQAVGETLEE